MSVAPSTTQQTKPSEFFVGTLDNRYNILNNQVNIDASGARVLIQRRTSNSGSSSLLGNACYNTKQTYFDISSSSDLRQYLLGFNILVKGYATIEDGRTPVDRTSVGIPWNSMGALLNGIQVRLNSSGNPVEIYSNNRYDVASTIRLLMEQSRTNLENMSETLFTPCFESDMDRATGFSLETQARSLKWLQDIAGHLIKRTMLWPLALLCSFAAVPSFIDIRRIELYLDWKAPNEVCFKKSAYAHTPYYFVEDVQCILDQSSMSVYQASMELKESISQKSTQRLFYKYYDVLETQYISSGSVVQNGVQNLESAVLCFPATVLGNPNYLQFTMNSLSTITFFYQGYSVPQTPMTMDTLNRQANGEAYFAYRKCCKKEFTTNYSPAIPYDTGFGAELNPHADETYFLYCATFSNSLNPHLTDAGELRAVTSQNVDPDPLNCSTNCKVYLVKIRNVAYEIHPDGTCEKWWA